MDPERVTDGELLALVVGSLEPDRAHELRSMLRASASLRNRFRGLRAQLNPARAATTGWRMPPPGYCSGLRPFGLGVAVASALSTELEHRVGERLVLPIVSVEESDDRQVLLLRARDDTWDLLAPTSAGDECALSDLARDATGVRVLELAIPEPSGTHRWAIALAPRDFRLDWSASHEHRAEQIRVAIARGELAVRTWTITTRSADDE